MPNCLCKPLSCKARPGTAHFLQHVFACKRFTQTIRRRSTGQQPQKKSSRRPKDKPRINRGSPAGQLRVFSFIVLQKPCEQFFAKKDSCPRCPGESSLSASCSALPRPTRRSGMCQPAPNRLLYVWVWIRQIIEQTTTFFFRSGFPWKQSYGPKTEQD